MTWCPARPKPPEPVVAPSPGLCDRTKNHGNNIPNPTTRIARDTNYFSGISETSPPLSLCHIFPSSDIPRNQHRAAECPAQMLLGPPTPPGIRSFLCFRGITPDRCFSRPWHSRNDARHGASFSHFVDYVPAQEARGKEGQRMDAIPLFSAPPCRYRTCFNQSKLRRHKIVLSSSFFVGCSPNSRRVWLFNSKSAHCSSWDFLC